MLTDTDEMALALLLLSSIINNIKKKKRQKRRYKVRPLNLNRPMLGFYSAYFVRMKEIDAQFFKYTRMDVATFDMLLGMVAPLIQRKTPRNGALSPEERLAITLHFLSQGSSMQTIAWKYHIGKTTVHCIIKDTCEAITTVLEPIALVPPLTQLEWHSIAEDFQEKWNFPHCVGALDGKHIHMKAPKNSGSLYYNYLKTFSIVLLAACDAHYRFTIVDIGGYGSVSDGGTLKDSVFGTRLMKGDLPLPQETSLLGYSPNVKFPYFFVADAAFPLHQHIMRPYPGMLLPPVKDTFNTQLSRVRRMIENSFGILAARWRILYTTINASVELVELITRTSVCLHNFLCKPASLYCPPGYADTNDEDNGLWRTELGRPLSSVRQHSGHVKHNLYLMRDHLAQYLHNKNVL